MIRACVDPPWAVRIEDRAPRTVMLVVRGDAWIVPDTGDRLRLREGELAIARGPTRTSVPTTPAPRPRP